MRQRRERNREKEGGKKKEERKEHISLELTPFLSS